MKQNLEILIERSVMRLAKQRTVEEGRSLNELIEEALVRYLEEKRPTAREQEMAYYTFCEQPAATHSWTIQPNRKHLALMSQSLSSGVPKIEKGSGLRILSL